MQLSFAGERELLAEITVGVHMYMVFDIYNKILSLEYESKMFQWCQFRQASLVYFFSSSADVFIIA